MVQSSESVSSLQATMQLCNALFKRYGRPIAIGIAIALLSLFLPHFSPPAYPQIPNLLRGNQISKVTSDSSKLVYGTITLNGRKLFDVAARPSLAERTGRRKTPLQQRIDRIEGNLKQVITTGFNPETLQITAKEYDQYTVLTASDPPQLQPIKILSITETDSELYGQPISRLTSNAIEGLKKILIQGYQELQPSYIHRQIKISLGIFAFTILLSLILIYVEILIKSRFKKTTQNQITQEQASASPEESTLGNELAILDRDLNQKEQKEIFRLKNQVLHWLQLLLWLGSLSLVLWRFPFTRPLGNWLFDLPVLLIFFVLATHMAIEGSFVGLNHLSKILIEHQATSEEDSYRMSLRVKSFTPIIKGTIALSFLGLGTLLILNTLGIPLAPILGGAGILGFAISFGSQTLIKDTLNGCLILFEDQYAIGDFITINEFFGRVENLNLRITSLRTREGGLITIPNSEIRVVQNSSKDWARKKISIYVSYKTDVDYALKLLDDLAKDLWHDPDWNDKIIEAEVRGVDSIDAGGTCIGVRFETKPGIYRYAIREYLRRVKKTFDRQGLELGMPQQGTIYRRESKIKYPNDDSMSWKSKNDLEYENW
ncbi:mechanosensitive ion channel family protein [Roseofilum sp. BLCC_M154]|uniref:Mechanosensitive ion channel family protein n=1 Tax=Roseofilum acuticapitatum BLCC-M154 TaxID=3022444 RepID=A0ABT7AZS3_9CYAN|nr:mechanosensitive ion channel family protein [Roseofilum acuticapitatum]MDJ1172422.1 mechanosensitive ion channel family protein [Roseofilum acuticapitatum BLCC-M154]